MRAGTPQPGQMLAAESCLHPCRKRPIAREVQHADKRRGRKPKGSKRKLPLAGPVLVGGCAVEDVVKRVESGVEEWHRQTRSLVVTSNWEFEQWTNFLPDVTAASAILDRILHHREVVVLNGDSNRLRQTKGVVRPKN